MTTIDRLNKFVSPEPNTGCWLWIGHCRPNGYGTFKLNGKTASAHRTSWELVNGAIPDGLQLDHLCRVRNCVNPDHLDPVSCRENLLRSDLHSGNKTHCLRGHAFDDVNTLRYRGKRYCRACHRQLKAARRKEVQS